MNEMAHRSDELPATRIESVADELYALLPAHIRQTDTEGTGALRALFDVFALTSAEIDAETDAFYDALFVETAGDAALPAIAALVGSTTLRPMPRPGPSQRAFIANTIRYRRGKGTARVIEALAADVTGLTAVAVEYFQRLARCNHLIDVRVDRPGTAIVRPGETAARSGGGFDALPRLLDVRPVGRRRPGFPTGRHSVTAVGVHLARPVTPAFPAPPAASVPVTQMAGVPPARQWAVGGIEHPGYFQLSAQPGRLLRLFNPDRRSAAGGGRLQQSDVPDRLCRLPLHHETDERRRSTLEGHEARATGRTWFDDANGHPFAIYLRRATDTSFTRVDPAELRIVNLETPPSPAGARPAATVTHAWFEPGAAAPVAKTGNHPIACAFDPVTGRLVTPAPAAGAGEVIEVRIAAATGLGRAIGAGAQDRNDVDQPFDIRDGAGPDDLVWVVDPTRPPGGSAETGSRLVTSLATALAEVAAQGAGRRSLVLLARCDLEGATGGATTVDVTVPTESEVHLVAAEWRAPQAVPGAPGDPGLRGFVIRRDRRFTVDAPLRVVRGSGGATARPGRLVIDGLELTTGLRLGANSVANLELRYVTLRAPANVALRSTGAQVAITVAIDSSICGPIRLGSAAIPVTGDLIVTDSVITADGATGDAVATPGLDCTLCDVTVFGTASMRRLSATNTIFDGIVAVTRRQSGCVRYSFVPDGSTTPRLFRCQPALALTAAEVAKGAALTAAEATAARLSVEPVFMDTSADEPTLALLHPLCPDAIRLGGEEEAEMGVFARAAFGIASANLDSLFPEFLPVALQAGVIDDTRSSARAHRRNAP